jgi:hypothetical protein
MANTPVLGTGDLGSIPSAPTWRINISKQLNYCYVSYFTNGSPNGD